MGFSRQEYWSGFLLLPPGDLLNPGIQPMPPGSPGMAGRFFTTEPSGKFPISIQNVPKLGLLRQQTETEINMHKYYLEFSEDPNM